MRLAFEETGMKIITLTLNPAFDIHCYIENFKPFHENLAKITDRDASGKGVNISRALNTTGVDSLAFLVLGDENGDSFVKGLEQDRLNYRSVTVKGRIRENITVHTNGADETRISFAGFTADDSLFEEVLKGIGDIDSDTVVTFTGRAPDGVSMTGIKSFLRGLEAKGARIVIDSKSFSIDDITEMRPWLIKPNQEEISEYLGRPIETFEQVVEAARELYAKGIANVMISLGERGALLVCGEGSFVAEPPRVNAVSTIGAGDSSIAGFLAAAKKGAGAAQMLCSAVSYGTSACMTEGTRPPRAEDVEKVKEKIKLTVVGKDFNK